MSVLHALALAVVLTAEPPANPGAVHAAVLEALRDGAPLPSGPPVLPQGGLPAGQETHATRAMKRDAERMAIEHAKKSVGQTRHEARDDAKRHGAMGDTMHGDHAGGDGSCDPAEMMRSHGTMPGQGPSMPGGSPHHGM